MFRIVKKVCSNGHLLYAFAYPSGKYTEAEAEIALELKALIWHGPMNPWCEWCPQASVKYEHLDTALKTVESAQEYARQQHAEQARIRFESAAERARNL